MREIKFRVFDKTTADMYFPGNDESQLIFGLKGANGENKLSLWGEEGEICSSGDAEFMQSVGLIDKNGVEIYEGDILNYKSSLGMTEKLLVVAWSEPDAMFEFGGIRVDYAGRNGEVIGNIHEHAHLLGA